MKGKILKKLVVLLLAIAIILGFQPGGTGKVKAADYTVFKASSFKDGDTFSYEGDVRLVMDTDRTFDGLFCGNLIVEGSGKLTVSKNSWTDDLTISKESTMIVKGEGLTLGESVPFAMQVDTTGNLKVDGSLTVSSNAGGIMTNGDVTIKGSVVINTATDGLASYGKITVNGGYLKVTIDTNITEPMYWAVSSQYGILLTGGSKIDGSSEYSVMQCLMVYNGSENVNFFTIANEANEPLSSVLIKVDASETPTEGGSGGDKGNSGTGSGTGSNGSSGSSGSSGGSESGAPIYHNEWVNGYWYGENGDYYDGILSWRSDSKGWWVQDTNGWYPVSSWQKIDGYWYYFGTDGYMASNEWIDGYYINADGTQTYGYTGLWKSNDIGWWFSDTSGWVPVLCWQKIDGNWYYFDNVGYMVSDMWVDGYYIDYRGICQ